MTYLKVEEIAEAFDVSKMTIYRLIWAGELPAVRLGRAIRVSDAVLRQKVREWAVDGLPTTHEDVHPSW